MDWLVWLRVEVLEQLAVWFLVAVVECPYLVEMVSRPVAQQLAFSFYPKSGERSQAERKPRRTVACGALE